MVKILVLHGFAQHPEEISCKTNKIQKFLHFAEFVFPSAAVELVSYDGDLVDRGRDLKESATRYSWNYPSEDMSDNLFNLEATLGKLIPLLETQGPFDGVLGFSQGAAVAGAMCSLLEKQPIKIQHPAFKFAVLFCGARPAATEFDSIFTKIRTPSLHVIGKQDVMVPQERSIQLSDAFEERTLSFHAGNHFIPQGTAYTRLVGDFIIRVMSNGVKTSAESSMLTTTEKSIFTSLSDRLNKRMAKKTRLIRRVTSHRIQIRIF